VTAFVFPDNTVLINFGYLHRMDLLERLVGNPAWCATVAAECEQSASHPDLEDMRDARRIFGEPLFPETPEEHLMTQTYRRQLARPGDPGTANLGEAETLAIIHCRGLTAVFFTDDHGPAQILVSPKEGGPKISVAGTWTLLKVAWRKGFVDTDTLWSFVSILRGKKRHLPPGDAGYRRDFFEAWLAE
jgi:hypothetical protein